MLSVLVRATSGRLIPVEVHDPLMRPIQARYGVLGDGETAVIEMAEASGLPLLTEQERNPMLTTSFGTGELIRHALRSGYRKQHARIFVGRSMNGFVFDSFTDQSAVLP